MDLSLLHVSVSQLDFAPRFSLVDHEALPGFFVIEVHADKLASDSSSLKP